MEWRKFIKWFTPAFFASKNSWKWITKNSICTIERTSRWSISVKFSPLHRILEAIWCRSHSNIMRCFGIMYETIWTIARMTLHSTNEWFSFAIVVSLFFISECFPMYSSFDPRNFCHSKRFLEIWISLKITKCLHL